MTGLELSGGHTANGGAAQEIKNKIEMIICDDFIGTLRKKHVTIDLLFLFPINLDRLFDTE